MGGATSCTGRGGGGADGRVFHGGRYRDAELPFKIYDIPNINSVVAKWSDDEYLVREVGGGGGGGAGGDLSLCVRARRLGDGESR